MTIGLCFEACCTDECQIFTGDVTIPCGVHVPYSAQIEHTGNTGTDTAWICCDEVNDVHLGNCEGCTTLDAEDSVLPFDESDVRCCIDYGFQPDADGTGTVGGTDGDCNFTGDGYAASGRDSGCIFVQRESTGDVYLGVCLAVSASTLGLTNDFRYRLIGWSNIGAGPIDPTAGPWTVTSFVVNEGNKCWDVTPGTVTVTLTDAGP